MMHGYTYITFVHIVPDRRYY